jgi:hypothetical protein
MLDLEKAPGDVLNMKYLKRWVVGGRKFVLMSP